MSKITIRFSRFLFLSLLVTLGAIGCSKTPEQKVEDAAQKVETQTEKLQEANKEYAAEWQAYRDAQDYDGLDMFIVRHFLKF